jgi:hypothetical protein
MKEEFVPFVWSRKTVQLYSEAEFTMFYILSASKLFFVDRCSLVPSMRKLKEEASKLQPQQEAIKGFILHDNCMESLL